MGRARCHNAVRQRLHRVYVGIVQGADDGYELSAYTR
jgi:hypothetical protein